MSALALARDAELRRLLRPQVQVPVVDRAEPPTGPMPPGQIAGRVLDPAGQPARARVDLRDLEGEVVESESTDEEGRFAFKRVAAGEHLVTAASFLEPPEVARRVRVEAGEAVGLELALVEQPRASIRGQVVDGLGQPLYGAGLAVRPEKSPRDDLQRAALVEATAHTDLEGTFELRVPGAGWYLVEVTPYLGKPEEALLRTRLFASADPSP